MSDLSVNVSTRHNVTENTLVIRLVLSLLMTERQRLVSKLSYATRRALNDD